MQFDTCIIQNQVGPSNYYFKQECNWYFCAHNDFWKNENQPLAIFSYLLQFIITGISSCTGIAGEVQKQSVLMTMLGYYQYESTNITYYVTLGCTISSLITIWIEKKIHLIDYDVIFLILPICVASTDLGNYFNRYIPDFVALLIIVVFEIFYSVLLITFALKYRKKEKKSSQIEMALQEQIINTFCTKPDTISIFFENSIKQSPYFKQLLKILIIQLSIQIALYFRSGNKYKTSYGSQHYWIFTLLIYFASLIILSIIYYYQLKQREKDRLNEVPDFCMKRENSKKFLIVLLGILSCFSTGLIGIGVGMFLASSLIIIKGMKLKPINVVYTVIICEMITSLALIEQSMINYVLTKPVNFVYYFFVGLVSSSIFFQFVRRIKFKQYLIPLISGILFIFDTFMILIFVSTRLNKNFKLLNKNLFESFVPNCPNEQ